MSDLNATITSRTSPSGTSTLNTSMTSNTSHMRYAQINKLDISNGSGVGIALFTAGCPIHCHNCFNSNLWSMDAGMPFTEETKITLLDLLQPEYIRRISILGGEPLIERNKSKLLDLIQSIRELYGDSKKIWLYTGRVYEDAIDAYSDIIGRVDILVDGPFVDELKDASLDWRGSSNQRVIDIRKTRECGDIVIYENKYRVD